MRDSGITPEDWASVANCNSYPTRHDPRRLRSEMLDASWRCGRCPPAEALRTFNAGFSKGGWPLCSVSEHVPPLCGTREWTRMTGRGLRPGRKRLAGFLAAAVMAGWSVGVPDSAAGKDACTRESAEGVSQVTLPAVANTAPFGSGTIAYNRQRPDGSRAGIWVADADGTDARRLTDHGLDPTWSPRRRPHRLREVAQW